MFSFKEPPPSPTLGFDFRNKQLFKYDIISYFHCVKIAKITYMQSQTNFSLLFITNKTTFTQFCCILQKRLPVLDIGLPWQQCISWAFYKCTRQCVTDHPIQAGGHLLYSPPFSSICCPITTKLGMIVL